MAEKLKVHEHYVLPWSRHAGTTATFDVVRSGSLAADPQWFPVRVSSMPTELPHKEALDDAKRMVVSPFNNGWLFTPEVPKNEFWEFMKQGMLGPTMDLVLPGANPLIGAVIHGTIDTGFEGSEQAKYFRRTLDEFDSIPYLDIVEIDWREMGSFWSLKLVGGPVRHLTIVCETLTTPRTVWTLIGSVTFANWVKQLFVSRYVREVRAEHAAVMDSFLSGESWQKIRDSFKERFYGAKTVPEMAAVLDGIAKAREEHLRAQGITDDMVHRETVRRAIESLERYAGLPQLDEFLAKFKANDPYAAAAAGGPERVPRVDAEVQVE